MKILIGGSRHINWLTITDMAQIVRASGFQITTLVSGKDRYRNSPDMLSIAWANANSIPVDPHEAKWNDLNVPREKLIIKEQNGRTYNARAGINRNEEMGGIPDLAGAIFIWDRKSRGTASMLEIVHQRGLPYYIVDLRKLPPPPQGWQPHQGRGGVDMPSTNEYPILFSQAMVRAILAGQKTTTRRLLDFPARMRTFEIEGIQSVHQDGAGNWIAWDFDHAGLAEFTRLKAYPSGGGFRCRYGKPGDSLWGRETWATEKRFDYTKPKFLPPKQHPNQSCLNGPDYAVVWYSDELETEKDFPRGPEKCGKIRPAIFMPRWASRLILPVVNICPQRLQDITEEEAKAEGVEPIVDPMEAATGLHPELGTGYRAGFARLWDQINGERSPWSKNDWVWAITFSPQGRQIETNDRSGNRGYGGCS
jgi:hypothetical protein